MYTILPVYGQIRLSLETKFVYFTETTVFKIFISAEQAWKIALSWKKRCNLKFSFPQRMTILASVLLAT